MKKISILVTIVSCVIALQSCEDWLDVEQEQVQTNEEDIFGNYYELQDYLSVMYTCVSQALYGPSLGDGNNGHRWAGLPNTYSDEIRPWGTELHETMYADVTSFVRWLASESEILNATHKRLWANAWKAVRISNVILENVNILEDATDAQRNGIIGQAYMGRALIYKYMLELWGGMPYLTEPLTNEDDWDIPRLSYYETAMRIVADCDSAEKYLPPRWDSGVPSAADWNNTENTARYTSVAAKALKSRILLYAASPLCNEAGDNSRWVDAAEASWEALDFAIQNGHRLLPMEEYYDNFYNSPDSSYGHPFITDETLLKMTYKSAQSVNQWTRTYGSTYNPTCFVTLRHHAQLCGVGVYQGAVDRFEAIRKNASGDIVEALPINLAEEAGWFNPQNPYANRDPRFYKNIHFHGKKIPTANRPGELNYQDSVGCGVFDMREGTLFRDQGVLGPNFQDNLTGYYVGKFWNGAVDESLGRSYQTATIWPTIRLSELYLNYAEAAAQAYGGANGLSPGASLTAIEALNVVRNRANMPDVDSRFMGPQDFLDRVLNERAVELCFEDSHRFIDVRRYKLIETDEYLDQYKISVTVDQTNDTITYPTGFKFEKVFLERKPSGEKFYFFPIPKQDLDKSSKMEQNPGY